jgi:hypothetical protein
VPSGSHPAKSSSGKLFCDDPSALYSLPSHSLKQWGQLGEILGGVRFPESGDHADIVGEEMSFMVRQPLVSSTALTSGGVVSNTDAAIVQIILILDATGIAPLESHIGVDAERSLCL